MNIAQLAEARGLNPLKFQFESGYSHHILDIEMVCGRVSALVGDSIMDLLFFLIFSVVYAVPVSILLAYLDVRYSPNFLVLTLLFVFLSCLPCAVYYFMCH